MLAGYEGNCHRKEYWLFHHTFNPVYSPRHPTPVLLKEDRLQNLVHKNKLVFNGEAFSWDLVPGRCSRLEETSCELLSEPCWLIDGATLSSLPLHPRTSLHLYNVDAVQTLTERTICPLTSAQHIWMWSISRYVLRPRPRAWVTSKWSQSILIKWFM